MPLLEAGRLIADEWVLVADDADLPADGAPALVSAARLPALPPRNAPLGVLLQPDTDLASFAPHLSRLALVALRFPKHRDGRGFTQARALRERYGFAGEIRATGHLLPDQYAFLLRCGVTQVELPGGTDLAAWEAARTRVPVAYQPAVAGDGAALGLLRRRLATA